mmetsp:Transcript_93954/g.262934  ORF Transcript_93954/g.262934 Transcript_93954/m.262934 type:complete len:244 (-) Transcript_93954:32-763(-)
MTMCPTTTFANFMASTVPVCATTDTPSQSTSTQRVFTRLRMACANSPCSACNAKATKSVPGNISASLVNAPSAEPASRQFWTMSSAFFASSWLPVLSRQTAASKLEPGNKVAARVRAPSLVKYLYNERARARSAAAFSPRNLWMQATTSDTPGIISAVCVTTPSAPNASRATSRMPLCLVNWSPSSITGTKVTCRVFRLFFFFFFACNISGEKNQEDISSDQSATAIAPEQIGRATQTHGSTR